jgi:hypothetical protein
MKRIEDETEPLTRHPYKGHPLTESGVKPPYSKAGN